jgi:hypothetical protein
MSEFLSRASPGVLRLMKSFDGRVVETSRIFHAATPASNQPALSPTRGSGVGGVVDMSSWGTGAAPACADDPLEQPVAITAPKPISEAAAHRRAAAEARGAVTWDSG